MKVQKRLRRPEAARMSGKLELRMKAFSNKFLWTNNNKLESGDKIILPGIVLEKITAQTIGTTLPHPIIFQIRNQKRGRVSHCGVLEFSGEEDDSAFLPKWMMENLTLQDGDFIELRLVTDIPKATALTFKPLHSSFAALPTPKETLEYALNEFAVLTEGDTIMIKHGTTSHYLTVTQVQPRKASTPNPPVQLLDTQVKVEFEEATIMESKEEDTPPIVLTFGEAASGTIAANRYAYYRVKVLDGAKSLKLTLSASSGDPDFYVSTQTKPTLETHTWSTHSTERKGSDKTRTLEIEPSDPNFSVNWFYIGVQGYKADATFTLLAEEVAAVPSVGITTGKLEGSAPDAKQCDNCKAMIPAKSFIMHQASCFRNNWFCRDCNTVMRKALQAQHIHCDLCKQGLNKDDLAKHMDVVHRKITCPCGEQVEPGSLGTHQSTECSLRMIECKHCGMKIQFKDQQAHEQYCGSKSSACELCGQQVPRRRMDHHRASEHGINPSLRTAEFGKPVKAPDKTATSEAGGEWGSDVLAALKASVQEEEDDDLAMQQAMMASLGQDERNEETVGEAKSSSRISSSKPSAAASKPSSSRAGTATASAKSSSLSSSSSSSTRPSSSSSTTSSVASFINGRNVPARNNLATASGRLNQRLERDAMTVSDDDDDDVTMFHTNAYGDGCVVSYPALSQALGLGTKGVTQSLNSGVSSSKGTQSLGLPSLERGQSDFSDVPYEDDDDFEDDGAFETTDSRCPYCHTPFARFELMEAHLQTCDKIE